MEDTAISKVAQKLESTWLRMEQVVLKSHAAEEI